MKKLLIVISFLIGVSIYLPAQVKNIQAKINAAQDKFIISYDLDKKGRIALWDISVVVSIDGVQVNPSARALSGEVGQAIKFGKKKSFVWDAYIDVETIDGAVQFDIIAKESLIQNPPSTDQLIGYSGLGLGAALVGVGMIGRGNKSVKAYNNRCDPEKVDAATSNDFLQDGISNTSVSICDNLYDEAKTPFKNGSTMAILGGVIALAGGYCLIRKPIYKKWLKAQNNIGLQLQPIYELTPIHQSALPSVTVGLQIQYKFGK